MTTDRVIDLRTGVVAERAIPAPTLAEAKAAKLAQLAYLRWRRQEAGVTVGGAPIKTDPESRASITAAYFYAKGNPSVTRRWKVAQGSFITLNAATMIAIGDAVIAYIQACFDREDALTTQILAAANLASLDAIDITADWPG